MNKGTSVLSWQWSRFDNQRGGVVEHEALYPRGGPMVLAGTFRLVPDVRALLVFEPDFLPRPGFHLAAKSRFIFPVGPMIELAGDGGDLRLYMLVNQLPCFRLQTDGCGNHCHSADGQYKA